ncbi:hypothetical protein CCZ01_01000 [Helicobacter monodelphidis]|uniref:hypothetical protein n=1 Tax=Helicobacter sp. 15-1451 TaxID=2004995 RepID=UPI000DCB6B6F|nr:hypothetical protein [Helicobacter sp. 15-1451]RAX59342.1 hypothetical protein CCZ01_01000 [Helicobacter sp. 15-1451]
MNDKELEIFNLCEKLSELLGDKEAIADLKRLYERHPEMFKDMREVGEVINNVVKEPDLIINNPKAKSQKDFIVAKQTLEINNKKMGDIGIRNDKGTNVIYHTNKQDKRNFNRFINRAVSGEAVHSLHTLSQDAQMGGDDKSSGVNTLSETTSQIIPQTNQNLTKDSKDSKQIDFIEKFKEFTNKKNIQQNNSQDKERQ